MNYPNGLKKKLITKKLEIKHANRGMSLEDDLNKTNEYYRQIDKAYIYKKPTPIKIVKVIFPQKKAKITEAYFDTPSTTDYNGIYKGKYIDFEAKETTSLTSFPLNNIHPHQFKHLENIEKHNGIAFLIIRFTRKRETYLLLEKELKLFLENNTKKSIPLTYFKEKAHLIKEKYSPRIDYLEILDHIGGMNHDK